MVKKTKAESTEQISHGFWQGLFLGVFSSLFLATFFVCAYLSAGGFRSGHEWNLAAIFTQIRLELPRALRRTLQDPERIFIPYEEGAVSLPGNLGETVQDKLTHGFIEEEGNLEKWY
jgi:hypothetical protein